MPFEPCLWNRGGHPVIAYDESLDLCEVLATRVAGVAPAVQSIAWTPILGGDGGTSGQAYAVQVGTALKIDKLIVFLARMVLSAKGTIVGPVSIQGLPFRFAVPGVWPVRYVNLALPKVTVFAAARALGTSINLFGTAGPVTSPPQLTTADFANNSEITIAGSYREL